MTSQINSYREQIDYIDAQILFYLRERIILSNKIGEIKRINKINILDENREKEIINKIIEQNNNMKNKSITNPFKMDDRYIHLLWNTILDMSKSVQKKKENES
jgi:chorismate mutase|uniref:Chorismate mutase domain-containing protein n=1 Tax=viral metagenome TaxID=1070528 RepID=A0A6C0C0V7_9ZZZZ